MDLPRGLFWLKAAGGMSEPRVNSLVKACEDLCRTVLIVTDLPVTHDSTDVVRLNEVPDGVFDYCFLCDADSEMEAVHDRFVPMVRDLGWRCWMGSAGAEPTPWDEAEASAKRILSTHRFDAVCVQHIVVNLGPNRDAIFCRSGVLSSVMSPNSGDGFWREVFRSSGFYGTKARMIRGEV